MLGARRCVEILGGELQAGGKNENVLRIMLFLPFPRLFLSREGKYKYLAREGKRIAAERNCLGSTVQLFNFPSFLSLPARR